MNNKKSLVLIVGALAVLLIGAGVLYNALKDQVDSPQLAVQSRQEEFTQEETAAEGEVEASEEEPAPQPPTAPDFTVYDPEGTPVKLSDFRGKPVVLNFWASWCGPCQMEMPHFQSAFDQYGETVAFLMVNCTWGRETQDSAKEFVSGSGYTFPVFYDTTMEASMLYGASSIPVTYFLDADGYAIARGTGALSEQALETGIAMIFEE